MILVICLAVGLLLRMVSGRSMSDLARARLRGETALLLLLLLQALLPLLRLTGESARVAFYVWLATFPVLASIAWLNRHQPGMVVLGAGLILNFVVIGVNGGMPVLPSAVIAVAGTSGLHSVPVGDFVHVVGSSASRLPWLADVLPVPGPSWLRSVASAGDCLLFVGVGVYLAAAKPSYPAPGAHALDRGVASQSGPV